MKIKTVTICGILIASLLGGCDKKNEISENVLTSSKGASYSFELKDLNSKIIPISVDSNKWKFENSKDKVVLLVFFATWCPPCKAEIPHLVELQKKYKDKLEIIAVLVEDGKKNEEIKKFADDNKINYTVTNSPENFVLASAVGGVSSIPAMFLFSKKGDLIQNYVGIVPQEMLESDVNKGLQ